MMSEHKCFDTVKTNYDEHPFVQPLSVNEETGDLQAHGWGVKTYRDNTEIHLYFNYCPFCGERLRDDNAPGAAGEE